MFGRKKEQLNIPPQEACPIPPPPNVGEVYVMPDKFHAKPKSSSSPLIISVVVLVVVLVAIGSYFGYSYINKPKPAVVDDGNGKAAINFGDENMTNTDAMVDASTTDMLDSSSTATSTASTTDILSTSTQEQIATTSISSVSLTPTPVSADTDKDGLTDLEENLIGTSITTPDTDKDGFKDGDEIMSGYNPLIANSSAGSKLEVAPFMKLVNSDFSEDNFSMPTIKKWSFTTVKTTKQAIITTDTGEVIKISVKDNADRLPALDWYLKANPQVPAVQLKQVEYGDLSGVITPDNLSAYLSNPFNGKIYSFEYIMDRGGQMRYPTMLRMMLKNFKLGAAASSTSSN